MEEQCEAQLTIKSLPTEIQQKIFMDTDLRLFLGDIRDIEYAEPSLKRATRDTLFLAAVFSGQYDKMKTNPIHETIVRLKEGIWCRDFVDIKLIISILVRKQYGETIGYAHDINELKIYNWFVETPLDLAMKNEDKSLINFLTDNGAKQTYNTRSCLNLEEALEELRSKNVSRARLIHISLAHLNLTIRAWLSYPTEITEFSTETIRDLTENYQVVSLSFYGRPVVHEALVQLSLIPALQNIDLANCNLMQLPDDFGLCLTNLRELKLWGNRLTDLPRDFENRLINLRILSLEYNKLSQEALTQVSKISTLKILNLDGNSLSRLPTNFGCKLTNLIFLNLDENPLNLEAVKIVKGLEERGAIVDLSPSCKLFES